MVQLLLFGRWWFPVRKRAKRRRCPLCSRVTPARNKDGHCPKCYRKVRCKICGGRKPLGQSWCPACERFLCRLDQFRPVNPPAGGHGEEHLKRLAERAARGLPLFG